MAGLLCLLASGWLAWTFGGSLSWWFGWTENYWLGPTLLFLGSYLTIDAIFASALSVLQLAGGGIWTAAPVRWMVGKFAWLLLIAPALGIIGLLLALADVNLRLIVAAMLYGLAGNAQKMLNVPLAPWLHDALAGTVATNTGAFWAGLGLLAALAVAVQQITPWEKPVLAYLTRPLRNLWRSMKTGVGGSASFMGLFDEWESALQWKPGRVLLGTSLYEPGQKLGKWDDRHIITIATTRSGKGRSCIIPNLLTWPGSALVIDPKGENAAVTARARRQLGQSVHIVDPFRLLERLGLTGYWFEPQRLNPLAEIRLDDLEAVEQIRNLAAALVMISPQANPFWDNASRVVLAGVIAHVMTSPLIADNERHLGTVRDTVAQTNRRKMSDLRESRTVGGLAEKGYNFYKGASADAGGDIMTTLNVHVEWLDSPAMQDAMTESDFSFAELKHGDSTVYLVIPPEYLDTHSRYLRLFITLALRAAGRGRKAQHAMLFIMDEFAALGELKVVATAAAVAAGSGVKLWPVIQNLTQLQVYGDNWDVFLANSGQRQIFAVNDRSTADYFSKELGDHIAWRKVRGPQGTEWAPYSATWLRTGPELARESSRDSEKAVILFEGGEAALVRRAGYDRLFTAKDYDRNPYQIAPPLFSWAALRAGGGLEQWWGAVTGKFFDRFRSAEGKNLEAWLDKQEDLQRLENQAKERKALPPPQEHRRDEEPDRSGFIRTAPLSRDELRAAYLRVGVELKASNYSSMTPEEQKEFKSRFDPFFGSMLAVGGESMDSLKKMLRIDDDPPAQEASGDRSAPLLPVPPLPKLLKAPPLKKRRKPRAKKTTP